MLKKRKHYNLYDIVWGGSQPSQPGGRQRLAYGRGYKRIQSRRSYRRKGRVFKPYRRLANPAPSIVPKGFLTKLKYQAVFNFTNGAGVDLQVFRGNSLFDPDYTGAGSQPNGFDELTAIYYKYRVYASSIIVHFDNHVEADTCYAVIMPSHLPTGPTNAINAKGNSWAKSIMIAADANQVRALSHYMKTKDVLDLKDIRDNVETHALYTANPSQVWYWQLHVQNLAANANDITAVVELTYFAEFSDIRNLNLS